MSLTVPAFLLIISGYTADGSSSQAVGVMEDISSCNNVANIIVSDYEKLVEAEKKIKEEDRIPRSQLIQVKCWEVEIPVKWDNT